MENPNGEEKSKTAQDVAKEATKDDEVTEEEKKKLAEAKKKNLVVEDYQLFEALNVLKSMVLAKQLQ